MEVGKGTIDGRTSRRRWFVGIIDVGGEGRFFYKKIYKECGKDKEDI